MAEFNLKVYRIFEKYRKKLGKELRANKLYKGQRRKSNRSKNRILDFYLANGRWPNRQSESRIERTLGSRFSHFVSKTAPSYDSTFRRLAMALGHKTNGKRKHNVQGFKEEIIAFMKKHGRVPTTKKGEKIPGEATLRSKLDYYTKQGNDMTLLGMVYKEDPCHRSGIPTRFRPFLNKQLDVEKPLIRLVKE
jgi:hypothetical protein